jgi:uncharacterized protein (TIGR03435 family)
MSELCKAIVFLLLASPAVAQSQAFEVISIKPARSGDPRNMRMRVLPNGDLNASAVPVLLLLRYAYDVPVNPSPRLSGLLGWRETYDIDAKAPASEIPPGLSEGEKRGRIQGMIRGLLADRFKLVMRVEQKTMPVYALSVARGGPNLQKSTIAEKDCMFDTGTPESCHNFIVGRGQRKRYQHGRPAQHRELGRLAVVNRTAVSGLPRLRRAGLHAAAASPPRNPPAARAR